MMRNNENPGIEQFIQAFSGIFRDIQQYSVMVTHIVRQEVILRHLLRHTELNSEIFRTLHNPCIYCITRAIFRTLGIFKSLSNIKMIRYI